MRQSFSYEDIAGPQVAEPAARSAPQSFSYEDAIGAPATQPIPADQHPLTVHVGAQTPAVSVVAPSAQPQATFDPNDTSPAAYGGTGSDGRLADAPSGAFWTDQAGKAAQAADDIVRLTANGMTLGYADKLAALGNGDSLVDERAKSQAAATRAGHAGDVATVLGMMTPSGAIGKAATGLGAAAEAVPVAGRILASPWTQAALTGAATGAGDAAGNDQNIGAGALVGAGAGVVGQGVVSGLGKVAGAFSKAPTVPSTEEVKDAARAAYQAADDAGVIVNPDATTRLSGVLQKDMADFGYDPAQQPKAAAVLSSLARMDGQNVTLKGLDTLRQVAGRLREDGGSQAELGRRLVNRIDAFTSSLEPADLVTGDMKGGVAALNDARSLWQRARKSEALDDTVQSAQLRAASTGSGGNVDNATRQNVRRLLESQDNWTPDERQAMLDVIKGTPTQNALRLVGKLSPHGNGLMAALNIGATMANPLFGVPALAGAVAKPAADAMTRGNVSTLSQLLRSGGDASALQPAPNALQRLTQAKGDLLSRLIMGTGVIENRPTWAR